MCAALRYGGVPGGVRSAAGTNGVGGANAGCTNVRGGKGGGKAERPDEGGVIGTGSGDVVGLADSDTSVMTPVACTAALPATLSAVSPRRRMLTDDDSCPPLRNVARAKRSP